ncbi:MAG: hypothetical protein HFI47_10320 [Lachnospiraceae bacterium]|nr:hypothetical protein [Lachnospiraceae bacterium]
MNRVKLGIKDLATGMRVDLDSMDEIHDVLIILGDIDDDTNSGVIKYIGTSDEEAAKAIKACNPVCIIDNSSEEANGVSYDE